ncbi:probable small G-protein Ras2 [Sporisorium scitamineum]|uniref:Probable small G-protein Ras2 n=1 Tax=Sporisorium scitamineum TaxID=49012 RepID=A0A0F7S2U0_9BASI|nr:probable small G-protein Ras2 [Sporisorium scitamineum]CDW97237.1 hypothetical protein [Sporisorium scitamineum]
MPVLSTLRRGKNAPQVWSSPQVEKPTYKLVVLGDVRVGKTALAMQLSFHHFPETYDATIEDSYRQQAVIDGESCILDVLDTAGHEDALVFMNQWVRSGDGFIIVYSVTNRATFEKVETFLEYVLNIKSQEPYPVPIMIVGNMCDKVKEREVSNVEGKALAYRYSCQFIETSAKTSYHVERAFHTVVHMLRELRGFYVKDKNKGLDRCVIM